MLDYERFKSVLVEKVQGAFGRDFVIRVQKVLKNNGVELDGMAICKEGCKAAPTMYLQYFYDLYCANGSIGECMNEIVKMYSENAELPVDTEKMLRFEDVKDRVVYKVVNFEKNVDMLKEMPYRKVLDLAMVYYLDLKNAEAGMYTTMVTNRLAEIWNVTEDEVYHLAVENTKRLMPVSIESMSRVMERILKGKGLKEKEEAILLDTMGESELPLYVLTNTSGVNGAAALFYEGVLRDFAAMMESDLFILPSSLHEVLLIKADVKDAGELQEMVSCINETEVTASEVLSDGVYFYSREKDRLEVAAYAL